MILGGFALVFLVLTGAVVGLFAFLGDIDFLAAFCDSLSLLAALLLELGHVDLSQNLESGRLFLFLFLLAGFFLRLHFFRFGLFGFLFLHGLRRGWGGDRLRCRLGDRLWFRLRFGDTLLDYGLRLRFRLRNIHFRDRFRLWFGLGNRFRLRYGLRFRFRLGNRLGFRRGCRFRLGLLLGREHIAFDDSLPHGLIKVIFLGSFLLLP